MKLMVLLFAGFFFLVLPKSNIMAEEYVFFGHKETVNRIDLDIALFDLKLNHFENTGLLNKYSSGVATCTWGLGKIHTNVFLSPSIMKDDINVVRARVKSICNKIYDHAKHYFGMQKKVDYLKDVSSSYSNKMEKCHININVHVRPNNEIIAEWRCGEIKYTDAFFKKLNKKK
jgi:hypothetical protein